LNLGDSGLVVFGDKAVPLGRRFWDCKGIDEIADRCTKPIDYGRAPPFSEAMYAVWLELVRGEFSSVRHWPRSSQRQWVEARHVLDEMSRRWEGRASIQFAYDGIRHDLHPKMRSQFVQRFLVTLASRPKSTMEQAITNIQRDAGEALRLWADPNDRLRLIRTISQAQQANVDWLKPMQTVLWWAHVIHSAGEPDTALARVLSSELTRCLAGEHHWVQLSAVFGLARLDVNDIGGIVDAALKANPAWSENPQLLKWLADLRRGLKSYPDFRIFHRGSQ